MFWDKTLQKRITELRYVLISQKLNQRLLFEKGAPLSSLFHPKKVDVEGFVIVLVLMPFSNKKSTIDLQRKGVYKSSAMHFKEVLSQNIWPIIRFMLFCPKTPCFTVYLKHPLLLSKVSICISYLPNHVLKTCLALGCNFSKLFDER